jgi:hypothetical protein
MRWPALARRRQVLLPTALGWLAIALLGCAALALGRNQAYRFLATSAPIPARILVVEGWIERGGLDQAIAAVRSGGYERVLTAGGPIPSWPDRLGFASYAELAADYLIRGGLPATMVTAVPAPASAQERTFLSAVEIRDHLGSEGGQVEALDVFSWGCHARRTRLLYRLAFGPGTRIGILAGTPSQFGPGDWWRSSAGAKSVVGEYLGLLWTEFFFWPPEPRSLEERWAVRSAGH